MFQQPCKRRKLLLSVCCAPKQISKSFMGSVGFSKLGITNMIFVDPGAEVNGAYYRDVLLSQQLLPMMRNVLGEFFIFQQDNAPAHWARDTVRLLEQATPAFIPPDLWPPNSLDINPMDYKIWGVVQERVYQSRVYITVSTKRSSVCFMFGMTWTKASLTAQLMNGDCVFLLVCEQRVDTTSTC